MQQLTPEGRRVVGDLAQRHGFGADAVTHMLFAVRDGNGTMAQFDHPEFAGSGQWMRGGMIMTGDMFNHALKGRIDALCSEISALLAAQPGLLHTGSSQSQSQGGGSRQQQSGGATGGAASLFAPDPDAQWWPAELGSPGAVGAQNDVRYAYFPDRRRLAVKLGERMTVHDTLDHRIGGFSQQQGRGASVTFTSQHGTVDLAALPPVGERPAPAAGPAAPARGEDILAQIERLGDLKAKGYLTDEEFARKKAELLARL